MQNRTVNAGARATRTPWRFHSARVHHHSLSRFLACENEMFIGGHLTTGYWTFESEEQNFGGTRKQKTPKWLRKTHTMAADPVEVPCKPFEQIGQDQETPTLVGAEESEAETEAHIKRINHLALRSLCSALTEFGLRAAESCVGAISFFGFVQALYNFFRHQLIGGRLCSNILKRADATKALANGYNSFQKALQSIAGDETQTSQAIHEVKCLLNDLGKNENAAMAVFWAAILDRINGRVQKRKRHHDDGTAEEVVFRGKEKLKVDTYLPVLDMLCTELSQRLEAYREINNLFGFLTDFSTKSDAEIRQACTKFKEHYFEDIEPEFIDEMVQYKYFILQLEDAGKKNMPAEESYKLIIGFPITGLDLGYCRCLMLASSGLLMTVITYAAATSTADTVLSPRNETSA
ncbi:hypothetical protein EVAR_55321_1 [Eumeta japonica]|uniref:Uncharacterized protein n=1 Tax=Eumeta variegata TaxID=151549 RepID=A0A4C1ZDB5_EUMVA|nr:hypothetical protein EVAR_55321_1 [Eumeta japonica]